MSAGDLSSVFIDQAEIERRLREVYKLPSRFTLESLLTSAAKLKSAAIISGDEQVANELWALETTAQVQAHYLKGFIDCREKRFYTGWCEFEQAEIKCNQVLRNFPGWKQRYWLGFIQRQVKWLQKLFPYRAFASVGIRVIERRCSICNRPLTLRSRCTHVKGALYMGKLCYHIISKSDLLEVSTVTDPVNKYAVLFSSNERGERKDRHNYSLIDYVIRGLRTPFAGFRFEETTRLLSEAERAALHRKDDCPCKSGKQFANCCIQLSQIAVPHCQIEFEQEPRPDFPFFSFPTYVAAVEDDGDSSPFDETSDLEKPNAGIHYRVVALQRAGIAEDLSSIA